MTDREKLIELLDNTGYFINREVVGYVANKLLANGVVVREKGEWIDTREYCGDFMCSKCDALYGTNKFNFCPDCGADMRKEKNG